MMPGPICAHGVPSRRLLAAPTQGDRRFDELAAARAVDRDGLRAAAGGGDHGGAEAGALDVDLQARAARGADHCAAGAAGALGEAARHMIVVVGLELAGEVELVVVAVAAQRQVDLMAGAAERAIGGVAADALGRLVGRLERAGAGPVAVELGERARFGAGCADAEEERGRRERRAQGAGGEKHRIMTSTMRQNRFFSTASTDAGAAPFHLRGLFAVFVNNTPPGRAAVNGGRPKRCVTPKAAPAIASKPSESGHLRACNGPVYNA